LASEDVAGWYARERERYGDWNWVDHSESALWRLHLLRFHLARRYYWTEKATAWFILTGDPPAICSYESQTSKHPELRVLDRLTIKVDPTLTPDEVRALYRKQSSRGRYRGLTSKHLALAEFWESQPDGTSARERMVHWNSQHGDWSYDHEKRFTQAAQEAHRRVLEPCRFSKPRDPFLTTFSKPIPPSA